MTIDWRQALRAKIGWLLLAKLIGLTVLWALFFSPRHRVKVTPERAARTFAVSAPESIQSPSESQAP
jgi:hypothetical protein